MRFVREEFGGDRILRNLQICRATVAVNWVERWHLLFAIALTDDSISSFVKSLASLLFEPILQHMRKEPLWLISEALLGHVHIRINVWIWASFYSTDVIAGSTSLLIIPVIILHCIFVLIRALRNHSYFILFLLRGLI